MRKIIIRVSDAIPEMPVSFEQTVNRTLNKVCTEQKTARAAKTTAEDRWTPQASKRTKKTGRIGKVFAYSAVAVLLVAVLAIGGVVMKNALFGQTDRPNPLAVADPETPNAGIPAIRYHGMLYRISESGQEYAGEIDESAIQRTTEDPVPLSEWPTEEGQTNFGEPSVPYAMTAYGLVVLIDNEWTLFEPLLPDTEKGLFEAAYAQVLLEKCALDREYARLEYIGEEPTEEVETKEFFLHQRFMRLQWICDIYHSTVSVEQMSGDVRLSEVAYAENVNDLYFAFAAPHNITFDAEPVIRVNGAPYGVNDDSGFFNLTDTQIEHYAFCSIKPGRLSDAKITVAFGGARFSFRYDANQKTVTLPKDDAEFAAWFGESEDASLHPTPEPDDQSALCLFFDGCLHYAPFENWIWSDQDDGIAADGMTFLWKMEEVRDKIPTIYNPGKLTVTAGDGVNLEPKVNIYDAALNTVAFGADISTVCTLDPGTYYISQRVSRREEGKTSGYECIVRIVISESNPVPEETPAPEEGPNKLLIPAIMYDEDLYVMHDELRPDAPDASAVKEVVTSLTHITQWPQKSGQANFGKIGAAFYVTLDGLVVYYNDEWRLFVPEEPGGNPDKVLWNDPNAFPGLFKFWDYDEENGYREAPEEGVLFVCDFDGDGTEDEIAYKIHGQYLTISLGKKSIDVNFGAGLEQAILLDLDPDSARLNLLVVYNTGSEDYETAELHMENGRFVRGPVIYAYCTYDGKTLRGAATQTDILGTKTGERTYHGENLTPDSEWYDCDVIPDYIPTARDRESLVENGKLLHLVRDLPCTIDGEAAMIPAGTYIYMTRWHESGTLAEIRTEDGTTALVAVREADPNDPDLAGCLIDGVMQYEYFDNIFFAD